MSKVLKSGGVLFAKNELLGYHLISWSLKITLLLEGHSSSAEGRGALAGWRSMFVGT